MLQQAAKRANAGNEGANLLKVSITVDQYPYGICRAMTGYQAAQRTLLMLSAYNLEIRPMCAISIYLEVLLAESVLCTSKSGPAHGCCCCCCCGCCWHFVLGHTLSDDFV